jgi:hypothetical protein
MFFASVRGVTGTPPTPTHRHGALPGTALRVVDVGGKHRWAGKERTGGRGPGETARATRALQAAHPGLADRRLTGRPRPWCPRPWCSTAPAVLSRGGGWIAPVGARCAPVAPWRPAAGAGAGGHRCGHSAGRFGHGHRPGAGACAQARDDHRDAPPASRCCPHWRPAVAAGGASRPRRFGPHGPPFNQCGLVLHAW